MPRKRKPPLTRAVTSEGTLDVGRGRSTSHYPLCTLPQGRWRLQSRSRLSAQKIWSRRLPKSMMLEKTKPTATPIINANTQPERSILNLQVFTWLEMQSLCLSGLVGRQHGEKKWPQQAAHCSQRPGAPKGRGIGGPPT